MTTFAVKPFVFVLVSVAILSTPLCSATPVGFEVKAGDDSDDSPRLEGESVNEPAGVAGCYDVAGFDTEEVSYTGALCITAIGDSLYELVWTQMEDDEGRVVYKGRGVAMGDDLFAVWSEDGTEYDCYLHLFEIDRGDGALDGLRVNVKGATSPQRGVRVGTGTSPDWSEPGLLAGSYVLEGSDDITGYRLSVTSLAIDEEDAYSFRWSGDTDLEGVGIRSDNTIVVVANPVGQMSGTCGSIAYKRDMETGKLVGTFYTPDSLKGTTSRRRGEETATPLE